MASFTSKAFNEVWNGITDEQRRALRDKAQWEHMSLSAVMLEWPSIIAPFILETIQEPSLSEGSRSK
jgi:hypothetical protein